MTAGESHGQGLISVIEGYPAGVDMTGEYVTRMLRRRQMGHGRGGRMRIEKDTARFLTGVRHGKTMGSPITVFIGNSDWENWSETMSPEPQGDAEENRSLQDRAVTKPRPGHADLVGGMKYGHADLRNVLERASARETAARVAAGSVAMRLLELLGARVASSVLSIGGVSSDASPEFCEKRMKLLESSPGAPDYTPVRCLDGDASARMTEEIDKAREAGDSLGGVFEVVVFGLPPGLGSYVQWDRKLDARLAYALMSIQAIKGVEFGIGFEGARRPGSLVHDEIAYGSDKGYYRLTNNSGGIEGGMTNGEPLVVRAAMKPIPTLYKPLRSVDIVTKEPFEASVERSDTCAVPAASVVGEAAVAWTLAEAFLEKFGGDTGAELKRNLQGYLDSLEGGWKGRD